MGMETIEENSRNSGVDVGFGKLNFKMSFKKKTTQKTEACFSSYESSSTLDSFK